MHILVCLYLGHPGIYIYKYIYIYTCTRCKHYRYHTWVWTMCLFSHYICWYAFWKPIKNHDLDSLPGFRNHAGRSSTLQRLSGKMFVREVLLLAIVLFLQLFEMPTPKNQNQSLILYSVFGFETHNVFFPKWTPVELESWYLMHVHTYLYIYICMYI